MYRPTCSISTCQIRRNKIHTGVICAIQSGRKVVQYSNKDSASEESACYMEITQYNRENFTKAMDKVKNIEGY